MAIALLTICNDDLREKYKLCTSHGCHGKLLGPEKNYPEAKAALHRYDTVFDARPTIQELPTSVLLNILDNHHFVYEYDAQVHAQWHERVRMEILKRCIDPPPFIPKMAREEYISSRRKMIQALISIQEKNKKLDKCKSISIQDEPREEINQISSSSTRWKRFMSTMSL